MSRYLLSREGFVIDQASDVCLGTVEPFGSHWIARDLMTRPLAGPTGMRDLAALTVIRVWNPRATLGDLRALV